MAISHSKQHPSGIVPAFVGNAASGFLSVFAIIDTHRTEHTTLDQLADYVAMAGLTRIDPDASLGSAPSILRLFAASRENEPVSLSSWDAAFLKALYQSSQTSRTQQLHDIAEIWWPKTSRDDVSRVHHILGDASSLLGTDDNAPPPGPRRQLPAGVPGNSTSSLVLPPVGTQRSY